MDERSVHAALAVARTLYPPASLVHVGAISGVAEMQGWHHWSVAEALAIDVCPEAQWRPLANARYVRGVVAETAGAAEIVRSRLRAADGLLTNAAVRAAWPGVRDLRTESVTTQTLDEIVPSSTLPVWLIVDAFPAGATLAGAFRVLRSLQVLWARVGLEPIADWPKEAGLDFVDAAARQAGFRRLAVSPGVDARFGQALYVRDPLGTWAALRTAQQDLGAARQEFADLAATHAALSATTELLQAELDETRISLAGEKSEKASVSGALGALRAELASARHQAEAARSSAARELAEKEALHATLAAEKEEMRTSLQAQVEELQVLGGRVAQLEDERAVTEETLVRVTAERDLARTTVVASASEKTSLLYRLTEIEAQITEKAEALAAAENQCGQLRGALVVQQEQRGQMEEVREEMTRAEAQLDLIKEIVGLRPRP